MISDRPGSSADSDPGPIVDVVALLLSLSEVLYTIFYGKYEGGETLFEL